MPDRKRAQKPPSGLAVEAGVYGAELRSALAEMVRGYEADCDCRNVEPANVMKNHTWLAMAYTRAKKILATEVPKS